ncbi:MAG: leucine-rich repeat domain-containing protein [Spirochaetaceae bacterium]|nr:leucine-rich repeat domain-containing protein [Spirochaetaceae bacterium]
MITAGAKSDCGKISSITIEDGVTVIGKLVFSDCTSLSRVSIPNLEFC